MPLLFIGIGFVLECAIRLSSPPPTPENEKARRFRGQVMRILGISCVVLDVLAAGAAAGVGGAILDGRLSFSTELGYALIGYGAAGGGLILVAFCLAPLADRKDSKEEEIVKQQERANEQIRIENAREEGVRIGRRQGRAALLAEQAKALEERV